MRKWDWPAFWAGFRKGYIRCAWITLPVSVWLIVRALTGGEQ
jgi:hypothetical protein